VTVRNFRPGRSVVAVMKPGRTRGARGVLVSVAAAAAALLAIPAGPAGADDCTVPAFRYRHGVVAFTEHGTTVNVRVEIADTEEAREVGLMCRRALDPDAGMLFLFADVTREPFWMKNTLIPLSIAFMDPRWRILGIYDMRVAPNPADPPADDLWAPTRPYRYALEVNQGFFAAHGIDTRAQVRFTQTDPPQP
jgi:uncharacterized membrane protein (UPF0127 family)